jgi:hypothetical protein
MSTAQIIERILIGFDVETWDYQWGYDNLIWVRLTDGTQFDLDIQNIRQMRGAA